MPYINPARNNAGIQWRDLRALADVAHNEMHDEFCAAHYDHWRHGNSFPWGPFDVQPTPEETEEQFVDLQTMLRDMHVVMRHKINHRMNQLGEPGVIPQDEYRYTHRYDENGNLLETTDEVMYSKNRLGVTSQKLGVKASTMMDHYRRRIKELNGPNYEFNDWDIP